MEFIFYDGFVAVVNEIFNLTHTQKMPKFTETRVSMLHGILLIALFACAAFYIGEAQILKDISFSPMIIGIILGMLYANSFAQPSSRDLGAGYSVLFKKVLRLGIILYGFRLTFQDIVNVGVAGIVVDVIIVVVTILGGIWIGRLLKMDRDTALLTSVGSGICGAAAVLGAESTIPHRPTRLLWQWLPWLSSEPSQCSSILSHIAPAGLTLLLRRWVSILVPLFMRWLIAVRAGNTMGTEISNVSIIVKMIRVMMLVPVLLILGVWAARRNAKDGATAEKGKVNIPWFAVGFLAVMGFNSLNLLPHIFVDAINYVDTFPTPQWPWLPWVQRQVLISLRRPVPSRLFLHSASMSGLLSVAISLPNILPRFACRDIIPQ